MNYRMVRTTLALAVLAFCCAGTAPSHAGVGPVWVEIGRGELGGGSDVGGVVDTVLAVIANVGGGHGKPCVPSSSSVAPGGLWWTAWQNRYTLEVALEWHGPGYASVSDDCADAVSLSVQVNDYAPSGRPPVAAGDPGSATDSTPSSGQFSSYAESTDWVLYYDPQNLYVRGNSVVELKVNASYFNPKGKVWVPIGCKVTHTSVRVWPDGSVDATTAPVEDCAA
jgi:hypothetical protein